MTDEEVFDRGVVAQNRERVYIVAMAKNIT